MDKVCYDKLSYILRRTIMAIRVAINGFGRIGRQAFKIALTKPEVDVVAINDLTDVKTLAHLLRYDSIYGMYAKSVKFESNLPENVKIGDNDPNQSVGSIIVDKNRTLAFASKAPELLPWEELHIDVVIESTGRFTHKQEASKHITAGAKRVVISAPSEGDNPAPTYVLGVNQYDGQAEVINNASCTTNCVAPTIKVLEDAFGIEKALMTTAHAYTQDQLLQDGPHHDFRRGRAAALSIIPTTTGAAIATTEAIPALEKKFDGRAIRIPVPCGSLSDITALLKRETSVEEINNTYKEAAGKKEYQGILTITEDPIVSSDIVGNSHSAIVDLSLTQSLGNLVKVFAWYDNEYGYSCRLVEQVVAVGKRLS